MKLAVLLGPCTVDPLVEQWQCCPNRGRIFAWGYSEDLTTNHEVELGLNAGQGAIEQAHGEAVVDQ